MVSTKKNVNLGFCQGVVRGQVYSPHPDVVMFDIRVKNERKNPKTKKREMQILNFVAKDETAKLIKSSVKDKDIVFVSYHLEERVNVNPGNGLTKFVLDRVVDEVYVRPETESGRPGYMNHGVVHGKYLGTTKVESADGIYNVCILFEDPARYKKQHFNFVVYGVLGDTLEKRFEKGQCVAVEYKVEKSKRVRKDGRTDYFTNLVLEKIA